MVTSRHFAPPTTSRTDGAADGAGAAPYRCSGAAGGAAADAVGMAAVNSGWSRNGAAAARMSTRSTSCCFSKLRSLRFGGVMVEASIAGAR